MSCNISDNKVVDFAPGVPSKASILASDVLALYNEGEHDLPSGCFLRDLRKRAIEAPDTEIALEKFYWYGEWSGPSWPWFLSNVAPRIKGHLAVVNIWEGGDSVNAIRIRNGVVTEHEVEYRLVDVEPSGTFVTEHQLAALLRSVSIDGFVRQPMAGRLASFDHLSGGSKGLWLARAREYLSEFGKR